MRSFLSLLTLLLTSALSRASEITFELPNNEKQCFHEVIEKGTESEVMFQVQEGGNNDVDCEILAPGGAILAKFERQQEGEHTFTASTRGEYSVCFGNTFSRLTHKWVFFSWEIGDEDALPGLDHNPSTMSKLEMSAEQVLNSLSTVEHSQTVYRVDEAMGRRQAEALHSRVVLWSAVETAAILVATVGQVMMLKHLFADKNSIRISAARPPYTSF